MAGKKSVRKGVKKQRKTSASAKAGKTKRGSKATKTAAKASRAGKRSSTAKLAKHLPAFLTASTGIDRLLAAKEEWSAKLLRPRQAGGRSLAAATSPAPENNVVGVGIGERIQAGRHTGVLALKFLVRVKYGDDQLTSSDRLPESIDGLPTDIEEVGTFRPFQIQDPRTMIRPSPPGCSVGFQDPAGQSINAGTFGALVRRGSRRFILSNNHVLAGENQLPIGAATFQPGFLDAGQPPNTGAIASLSAFRTLETLTPNSVDCAISEVSDPSLVTNSIIRIGVPNGTAPAQTSMIVHKFGRTTGYRVGFVDQTVMDVSVDYDIGTLTFNDQIIIKGLNGVPFSSDGDSGALVVERNTSRAIGLLFAGSDSHTIANHIGDVLQALNVSLA